MKVILISKIDLIYTDVFNWQRMSNKIEDINNKLKALTLKKKIKSIPKPKSKPKPKTKSIKKVVKPKLEPVSKPTEAKKVEELTENVGKLSIEEKPKTVDPKDLTAEELAVLKSKSLLCVTHGPNAYLWMPNNLMDPDPEVCAKYRRMFKIREQKFWGPEGQPKWLRPFPKTQTDYQNFI